MTVQWQDSHDRPTPTPPHRATATHRGLSLTVEATHRGYLSAFIGGTFAGAHCMAFADTSMGFVAAQDAAVTLADALADAGWIAR